MRTKTTYIKLFGLIAVLVLVLALVACGDLDWTPAHEHKWVEHWPTAATCSAKGSKTFVCADDSTHTKTEEIAIDPNAHNWGEWVGERAPTCEEGGSGTRTCKINGTHIEIDDNIPALGHEYEWETTTPATCSAEGERTGTCIRGDDTVTQEIAINPNAHGWGGFHVITIATCSAAGKRTRECEHDGSHTEDETIPIDPSAHDWGEYIQTTPPTCTTAGIQTRACTHNPTHINPVTEVGDPIDPEAHGWEWVVTTPASILAEGEETNTCKHDLSHTNGTRSIDMLISIIEVVQIPAGTFQMGAAEGEPFRQPDETPQHSVTLTQGFYMGKYTVTQEQYQAVMGTNPSWFSWPTTVNKPEKRPVETVSWYDALVFCNKLSVMEGLTPAYSIGSTNPADWGTVPTGNSTSWNNVKIVEGSTGYRLPTEAQWEYACRAGTTTAYNTGATMSYDTGWYSTNSSKITQEVGQKTPNAWGLYDMHGNVWEWCWDWYNNNYYTDASAGEDPMGASSGSYRVQRGGAWGSFDHYTRSARRSYGDPSNRYDYDPTYGPSGNVGFRLVRP